MKDFKSFFQKFGAYWGLLFMVALVVPYALGIWDDIGYTGVVVCVVAFLAIILLGRHIKPTFWWEGLRKKKKNVNEDKNV
jgi:hypothetical protein